MRAELSTAPIFTSGDGEVPYDAIGNWNNTISPLLHRYCQMTSSVPKLIVNSTIDEVISVLYTKVIFSLAIFGLLGNTLNFLVLTFRTRQCHGRLERFAYTGLLALAVADGLFCLGVLPHGFSHYQQFVFRFVTFDTIYGLCGIGLFNTCITCSTWLTVMLACGRYIGVCHPMKARQV